MYTVVRRTTTIIPYATMDLLGVLCRGFSRLFTTVVICILISSHVGKLYFILLKHSITLKHNIYIILDTSDIACGLIVFYFTVSNGT